MTAVWLIKVEGQFRPHPAFRWWRRPRCWGARYRNREHALAMRDWLLARGIHFKAAKADDRTPPKKKSKRSFKRGPAIQVIDSNADPKAAMIAAYRKMEWQQAQREFTAAAPQHKPSTPPEPINPPAPKRYARDAAEARARYVLKSGAASEARFRN